MLSEPDTYAMISKKGWRVLLALQLVVTCVRQGRDDWQEWSAVAVTEHQNVANLSGGLFSLVVSKCGCQPASRRTFMRQSLPAPRANVLCHKEPPGQHRGAPEAICQPCISAQKAKGLRAKVFCASHLHFTPATTPKFYADSSSIAVCSSCTP